MSTKHQTQHNFYQNPGILLACMPKSGSTATSNMLAQLNFIRKVGLVPGYDIREQEIDLSILEQNLRQNIGTTFIAQHHIVLSNTTLRLINMKKIFPVVLTRNLPDA